MTAAGSTVHGPQVAQRSALRIAVIGAGPAGLATGHELLAHGFDNVTIYEGTVAVRTLGAEHQKVMGLAEAIAMLKSEGTPPDLA